MRHQREGGLSGVVNPSGLVALVGELVRGDSWERELERELRAVICSTLSIREVNTAHKIVVACRSLY